MIPINEIKITPESKLVLALIESKKFDFETTLMLEFAFDNGMCQKLFSGSINESYIMSSINEGKFADWIKDKAEKVKGKAAQIKDKGLEIFSKIGTSFSTFVKFIVTKIKEFLNQAWEFIKKNVFSNLDKYKSEVIDKIKVSKTDPNQLKTELDQMKSMSTAAIQLVGSKIPAEMEQGMNKAGAEEVSESFNYDSTISESLIYEFLSEEIEKEPALIESIMTFNEAGEDTAKADGAKADDKGHSPKEGGHGDHGDHGDHVSIPGISKLAHKIGHIPPFSYLHNIEEFIGKKTNNFLQALSAFLHKKGAISEPYEFSLMGSIAGLIAGAQIKSGVTALIKELGTNAIIASIVSVIPGIGTLLMLMKSVAKALWLVGVAEAALQALS